MSGDRGEDLARNLRRLRELRSLSQEAMARLAGIPRATWTHLESGAANPTLSVLTRVAAALRVSLEELVAPPLAECRMFRSADLKERTRGDARIRQMIPDPTPGLELERLELPARGTLVGSPHTPGTREYLTCESGSLELAVAGGTWTLAPGDLVVFRGDQRHSYRNPGRGRAIGYSVVLLAPGSGTESWSS